MINHQMLKNNTSKWQPTGLIQSLKWGCDPYRFWSPKNKIFWWHCDNSRHGKKTTEIHTEGSKWK